MTSVKQIVPTAINSVGILALLGFNLKKFKELEDKILELEEKLSNHKPVPVDNTELFEKINKRIEEIVPFNKKEIEKGKDMIKEEEKELNISKEPTEEDVDLAISELKS